MNSDIVFDYTSWTKLLISTFKVINSAPTLQRIKFVLFPLFVPIATLAYFKNKFSIFLNQIHIFFLEQKASRLALINLSLCFIHMGLEKQNMLLKDENLLLKSDSIRALLTLKELTENIENRRNGASG